MEIGIKITETETKQFEINNNVFKRMMFLHNALNNGWSIKKRKDYYIFTKNHEGKKEVFDEKYLATFIKDSADINKLLS